MKNDFIVVCPKCGKEGFASIRWVQSSYYPKFTSLRINRLEEFKKNLSKNDSKDDLKIEQYKKNRRITGDKYRGKSNLDLFRESEGWKDIEDKSGYYKVRNKKHHRLYVGHYDSTKYFEQMDNYKNGIIKSRPNGRKWCLIPKKTYSIKIARKDGTGSKVILFGDLVDVLVKRKKKTFLRKKDL